MASVTKDAKGWRVRFYASDNNLRTIRPGKVNKATAQQIGRHVDNLVARLASNGILEKQTAHWLGGIGEPLRKKLERAGLVEPVEPVAPEPEQKPSVTLAAFLEDHIDHGRTSHGKAASESTVAKWRSTQRFLNEQFPGRTLDSITPEDAHQFRVWLDKRKIRQTTSPRKGEPMAENGKRKHIANCKAFFNAAKRRGLIAVNPFENQVSSTGANRQRDHYITPEDTQKILNACPDAQWRLLVALWRLAGLRKMEVFNLTWGNVLWDAGKLLVRSTKTQHVEGCEMRYVPIRDVRPYLEDAFRATGKARLSADEPIITRFSKSNSNLDKPFRLIVEKAGLIPWPKLFQNLRASCETQWLKEGGRADLVANWIGHSVKVQNRNYVQQTDDDIEAFNAQPGFKSGHTGGHVDTRNGAKRAEVAIQVAMSSGSKNAGTQHFIDSSECERLPWAGLEPARSELEPQILSLMRLPIPPPGLL